MTTQAPARRASWHDAFDTQMALWRWTRSGCNGEVWLQRAYQVASEGVAGDTAKFLLKLYASENRKLLDADPIFVSAEMCELVDAARASFDLEPLYPTDLITAHGFMVYETPIVMVDKHGKPLTISAVGWAPVMAADDYEEVLKKFGADPLEYFKGKDYTDLWAHRPDEDIDGPGSVDGITVTLYSPTASDTWAADHGAPGLVPIHVTPWWFGMTFDGNEIDVNGEGTGAEWWWRCVQTTLRLMQQQLSSRYRYKPDRAGRREAKKRGFAEREVTVVQLRRKHNQNPDAPQGEANYSHRFIVGGHWRNQWYPGSSVHRQIWISDYVKGPENMPLMVKPRRVFTWTR